MGVREETGAYLDFEARKIPVVDYVQAGTWGDVSDPYARGQGSESIGVDAELARSISQVSFALVIDGESMYDPKSPDCFAPGDIVIIDPLLQPRPGEFVVAKLDGQEKATFKKYRERGNDPDGSPRFDLVPLNDGYQTIEVNASNPGRIIGVMVEHRRRRRVR